MLMATIDQQNHSKLTTPTLVAASCAKQSSSLMSKVRGSLGKIAKWAATSRSYYSAAEQKRYQADVAVRQAQFKMRSFY